MVSTHLLADVEAVCESVVVLDRGRVRGQGAVRELCATLMRAAEAADGWR